MPLVEAREAAAPATSAAEKFRLVIIMVLILCIGGAKSTAKGLPAEMLGRLVTRDVVVVENNIPSEAFGQNVLYLHSDLAIRPLRVCRRRSDECFCIPAVGNGQQLDT
jgi:hypothetical protein